MLLGRRQGGHNKLATAQPTQAARGLALRQPRTQGTSRVEIIPPSAHRNPQKRRVCGAFAESLACREQAGLLF